MRSPVTRSLLLAACLGTFTIAAQAIADQSSDALPAEKGKEKTRRTSSGQFDEKQLGKLLQHFDGNDSGDLDALERKIIEQALEKHDKNPEQIKQLLDRSGLPLDGSAENLKGKPANDLPEKFLELFDQDGDGQLGPQERAKAKLAKERLDRNSDGQVEKRELPTARQAFDRADRNDDGQLSPREKATAKKPHQDQKPLGPRDRNVNDAQSHKSNIGQSEAKTTERHKPAGKPTKPDSKSEMPNKGGPSGRKDPSGGLSGKHDQGPKHTSLSKHGAGGPSGGGKHAGNVPPGGSHRNGLGGGSKGADRNQGAGGHKGAR